MTQAKTVEFNGRITQIIIGQIISDRQTALQHWKPMGTRQFVVWHRQFILAERTAHNIQGSRFSRHI